MKQINLTDALELMVEKLDLEGTDFVYPFAEAYEFDKEEIILPDSEGITEEDLKDFSDTVYAALSSIEIDGVDYLQTAVFNLGEENLVLFVIMEDTDERKVYNNKKIIVNY